MRLMRQGLRYGLRQNYGKTFSGYTGRAAANCHWLSLDAFILTSIELEGETDTPLFITPF